MRMFKNPIPKTFPDHQKAFIYEHPFEHVIEYEFLETRSQNRCQTIKKRSFLNHVLNTQFNTNALKPDPKTDSKPLKYVYFWTSFCSRNWIRILKNPIPKPFPDYQKSVHFWPYFWTRNWIRMLQNRCPNRIPGTGYPTYLGWGLGARGWGLGLD